MYNPIELPSLEQIEAMDQQRNKAIESLEISSDQKHVKCQECGSLKPIRPAPTNSQVSGSSRIHHLQAMIRHAEKYHVGIKKYSCKNEKQELKQLLEEEDSKRDLLRRIPLYSSKITDYRFFCSECYDGRALLVEAERKKKKKE